MHTLPAENVNRISTSDHEATLGEITKILMRQDLSPDKKCIAFGAFFPKPKKIRLPRISGAAALRRRCWNVWKKTGGKCFYCARVLNPFERYAFNGFHVEHVIPRARGGSNFLDNLVPSCSECNFSKGAKTPEQWGGR